jgi:heptosyltransferase-3
LPNQEGREAVYRNWLAGGPDAKGTQILAIRFARLGDVILLLPALISLKAKFPGSQVTLLTGHRCAPIAELCPAIDTVLAVDRVAMRDGPPWRAAREMARLVREVRRKDYDVVVDFHSFRETNLLAWLSDAPIRIGMKRQGAAYLGFCFNQPPVAEDKSLHVAEMFQKVVDCVPSTAPAVQRYNTSQQALGRLRVQKTDEPNLVLYVDAPVPARIWPPERFAAVADHAIEKLRAAVTVISSNEGAALAARVQKATKNRDRLSLFTDLTLPELARMIASARLLISNDTGPMHIGPAVGVRTLGLFSIGFPEHFRPIGPCDRFLRANPIDQIQVQDVVETIEQMWLTADPNRRC